MAQSKCGWFPLWRYLPPNNPALFKRWSNSKRSASLWSAPAAVKPEFSLTAQNASAVLQVCQRLDGIPLALELAAARVTVLSVAQIAARLEDRFTLLTTGSRTALPRHQTLRAALDWSYELLTEQEKLFFRRLSVFGGGWTLEAAESVCAGGEIQAPQVLDLLSRLISKSLVNLQAEGDATRYLSSRRFASTLRTGCRRPGRRAKFRSVIWTFS